MFSALLLVFSMSSKNNAILHGHMDLGDYRIAANKYALKTCIQRVVTRFCPFWYDSNTNIYFVGHTTVFYNKKFPWLPLLRIVALFLHFGLGPDQWNLSPLSYIEYWIFQLKQNIPNDWWPAHVVASQFLQGWYDRHCSYTWSSSCSRTFLIVDRIFTVLSRHCLSSVLHLWKRKVLSVHFRASKIQYVWICLQLVRGLYFTPA